MVKSNRPSRSKLEDLSETAIILLTNIFYVLEEKGIITTVEWLKLQSEPCREEWSTITERVADRMLKEARKGPIEGVDTREINPWAKLSEIPENNWDREFFSMRHDILNDNRVIMSSPRAKFLRGALSNILRTYYRLRSTTKH